MGLLDDAIREHLDLKRRRGADPGELARQEQEALGPPRRVVEAPSPSPAAPVGEVEPDPDPAPEPLGDHGGAVSLDRFEDELEWSAPPPRREPEPDPVPAPEAGAEPPPEDVLEETPEFLSETPEHDRLWFEQRPPRDFDY